MDSQKGQKKGVTVLRKGGCISFDVCGKFVPMISGVKELGQIQVVWDYIGTAMWMHWPLPYQSSPGGLGLRIGVVEGCEFFYQWDFTWGLISTPDS